MKKLLSAVAAAVIFCFGFAFSSCKDDPSAVADYYFYPVNSYEEHISSGSTAAEGRGYAMGTDVILRIADADNFADEGNYEKFKELWNDIRQMLIEVNSAVSATLPTSCVSAFNAADAGEKVRINKTAYDIISLAQSVYEATDGYFNPAVYHSLQLYGFDSGVVKKPSALPDAASVAAFKTLADSFADLSLIEEDGNYYALKPSATVTVGGREYSLALDLGGIGKGWCADRADELIEAYGFEYGLFYFGSSTMALNKYYSAAEAEDFYNIILRDPRGNATDYATDYYAKLHVKDSSLSSSGDYMLYYEYGGVRYCHIIDPKTGSPIQTGIATVTIIGGSAAEDDALTTALSAMGRQKAEEYIAQNLSDRQVVMLVIEDGEGIIVSNCTDKLTVINQNYSTAAIGQVG